MRWGIIVKIALIFIIESSAQSRLHKTFTLNLNSPLSVAPIKKGFVHMLYWTIYG